MRKFAYYCLDCEAVFELERCEHGVTCCPRCGRRRIVPLGLVFPFVEGIEGGGGKKTCGEKEVSAHGEDSLHEALCAYCTENCPLAGAFITKEKEVGHEH